MNDEQKIPKGRVRRSTKLASAVGGQAARYAGTAAANVGRSDEAAAAKTEERHIETALKMLRTLGEMKGAALKLGQLASFIDTDFLPPEFQEIYQRELSKLQTSAPAMPWEQVREVLVAEYEGEDPESVFAEIEHEAFAAASIGQVHRAKLDDGRKVAVKIQYPGVAEALEADMRNAGMLIRLGKAFAPGLDPKELAAELKERILEELDYELEATKRQDEGDPGSYIDKILMEQHPELLLEGMALAGYAVGADHGFVLTRSEYPRSKPTLDAVAAAARSAGVLGPSVLGSDFAFDVTIVEGAGSYVVGEETALLACLQGLRGTVSARPPFPAQRGLHGMPTVVNNVETLCNIPVVARVGAERYVGLCPGRPPARSSSASTSASSRPASTRCRSG